MRTFFLGVIISSYFIFACTSDKQTSAEHDHSHVHSHDHDHSHDGHDHSHDNHDHDDHNHDHEDLQEGEVAMSDNQFKKLGMELATATSSEFHEIIKTSGQLIAPMGDENTIVARSNGIISFTKKTVAPGTRVGAGEKLALISARNLAEGDQFSKTKLEFELTEKEFLRAEALLKDSLISIADFNRIKNTYESATVAYRALASNASEDGIPISSTMNGYIKNILVADGSYVSTGQAIATITSNRRIQLRAELPERYVSILPNIQSANFKGSDGTTTYDLKSLNGNLVSYARTLTESSVHLPVSFEFDNTGHLVAGSFVEVYLKTVPRTTMTLPLQALIEEHGLYFVYIKERDGVYLKQPIKKGADDGLFTEILAGIAEGDQVVTKGAYYLKLASMSAEIPHGHAH